MEKVKKMKQIKDDSPHINKNRSQIEKIVYTIAFVIFCIYTLSIAYPLFYLIIKSLQDCYEAVESIELFSFKRGFHLENYYYALFEFKWAGNNLINMFVNSVFFTVIRIAGAVIASTFTGYVFSKYNFKGRPVLYAVAIFSMTVPVLGSAASMLDLCWKIGIYNNWLFPVVTSFGGFGFNFLVMYAFFDNVSWSYAEATFIDGGGHFTVFFKVMIPQAVTSMITLAILAFIGNWNNYMDILLYMPDFPTLASGLYVISQSEIGRDYRPRYFAGLVYTLIPVLTMFCCFSDVIMKNLSIGGLKG